MRITAHILVIFSAFAVMARAERPMVHASEAKAVFVINIARFTNWPCEAFQSAEDPLVIAVRGDPEVANALRKLAWRPIHNRRVVVTESFDPRRPAHVLFASHTQSRYRNFADFCLVISDNPLQAGLGDAVAVDLSGGKLEFEVNLSALRRAGLSIDSSALELARRAYPPATVSVGDTEE